MAEILQVIRVGIADIDIVKTPNSIRTSGLGSCVGVVVYDQARKVAGLAHIMLPESSLARTKTFNAAKYADTAVKELVARLVQNGARQTFLKAKIAGGAQMFKFSANNDLMRIGPRNVDAVKKELSALNISIIAEDVGGSSGRTIEFNPETCILNIRKVNKETINL